MSDDYTLTKHRGKLALTIRVPGRSNPIRISTGTADRGLAEARAREIWAARTAAPSERIEDLWPVYAKARIREGAGEEQFVSRWAALRPHFGHRLGKAITREDCRVYYTARIEAGASNSTVRIELSLLRACLRWHFSVSAPSVWVPPASAPRDRWLTKEEARTLVDAAETPHVKLFLILGLATGARAAAILDLTWDRVDFTHGTVDFRPAGRHQTNKRRTVVPINANAKAALEEAYKGRLTDHVIEYHTAPVKSVKKAIKRLGERTGIPLSPHVLRHTCAVWMAQADIPMQKISQYLGHTSVRVTESVYARYSPSYMRDASDAVAF